jgi:type II secretory pathway pseudopilin PulG
MTSGMKSERGFTLVELIVGMFSMIVILTAIMMLVRVSTTNQDRVAERVAANQKIRPVMTRLIDTLHSACIAPGISPIQTGSSGSSMVVLSKAGSDVAPVPDRRTFTLTGSVLTEDLRTVTGGTIPNWTFSSTSAPNYPRTLLTGVSAGAVGSPPVAVPAFRYYAYTGDTLSSTPLTVPLSAADAARTAHVAIAFAAAPSSNTVGDEQLNRITLADSASLRLESASEAGGVNMPCV